MYGLHEGIGKCELCGKFVSSDDGFYDRLKREDDLSEITIFCNENHSDIYHNKRIVKGGKDHGYEGL